MVAADEQNLQFVPCSTREELERDPELGMMILCTGLAERLFEMQRTGESIEQECLQDFCSRTPQEGSHRLPKLRTCSL